MTSGAPSVNGTVNSIAFRDNCARAYIGGSFSAVEGTRARNIAEISTRKRGVMKRFAHRASGELDTVLAVRGRIVVRGDYTSITGSSTNKNMTGLNPITGKDNGFVRLKIRGHYQYPGVSFNPTKIYNQALSHNRNLDLVMGDFTSVGGRKRQQILMPNFGGSKAKVTGWTSPAFNGHCVDDEPFYVRSASWSPNDSRVYIATGALFLNKIESARYHERSGGHGAEDMLITHPGLWIAGDNFGRSQTCGFVSGLSGICFLPYG